MVETFRGGCFCGAVLFARKQIWVMLTSFAVLALARVGAVYFGGDFGVTGITIGLAIINVSYYVFALVFVSPIVGNRRRDLLAVAVGPILASILAGGTYWYLLGNSTSVPWMAACLGIGLLTYAITLTIIDFRNVKRDAAFGMTLVRKRQAAAQ